VTPLRVSFFAALISFALLVCVLDLIRRRKLRERYALLWLLTACVLIVLSLWRSGLDTLAGFAGISYAPSALFAVAAVFIVVVLLHYSTVISRLSDENAILAQRVALLEAAERGRPGGDEREAVDAEADEARVGATFDELHARRHDPQRLRRVAGQLDAD
jgi:hypothetical protein